MYLVKIIYKINTSQARAQGFMLIERLNRNVTNKYIALVMPQPAQGMPVIIKNGQKALNIFLIIMLYMASANIATL
jgi:hypothetical protein